MCQKSLKVNSVYYVCHFVSFARLRGASDSHHAGTGMLCCHAVWRCPPSPAGGYAKQVHQWVTHVAWLPLFSIHTDLSAKNVFVRNTWRELYKQMLHNIRNERTTGNVGNYRIRDSFWFMVPFHCLKRAFKWCTHHSWQPQIILEDMLVLLKVYRFIWRAFFLVFWLILRSGQFLKALLTVFAVPVNDHWDSSEQREKGHMETCGGFCLVPAFFRSPSRFGFVRLNLFKQSCANPVFAERMLTVGMRQECCYVINIATTSY